ncbi:biopolymer transport protein ExbD [Thiohalomonas denitrificans]|uniref:Biopolymer transport protein ExbD n=2 Tax=Thiohalomonas denitrificans TaxID=415747 RepID=A0A1G5QPK8_9GAMM|nr:biopolymer transport protein ExbD [Thiohalomonas denitrificans]
MRCTIGTGESMHFEGRRRATQMPNLTPLIDAVFLLLVFFMLTSHFVREEALNIDLPVAESGEATGEDDQLEVIINAQGRFLMNDHVVDPEALEATLRRALEQRENRVVRIRGDRGADLGSAVKVLDTARKAGAEAVDIVTETK